MRNNNGLRVCLIHGSTQSHHGWDLLVHELMAWGVDVTAVDLPSAERGADFFAQQVCRQIPPGSPPVVVAHCAAGLILPLVAEHLEVSRLVYLAAVIPKPQTSFLDQLRDSPEMMNPAWHGKYPIPDQQLARRFLFHDCEPRIQEWALTTLWPWFSRVLLEEACPLPQLPPIPSAYISATQDQTINPVWWESTARIRLNVEPMRIDSGHAPHVSRPHELARMIMDI